jgi:hypothetical protein
MFSLLQNVGNGETVYLVKVQWCCPVALLGFGGLSGGLDCPGQAGGLNLVISGFLLGLIGQAAALVAVVGLVLAALA